MRRAALFLALASLLGCDRLLHRHAKADASSPVIVGPITEPGEDEEEVIAVDAGACPIPIHPGYCRYNCRSFANRQASKHARRITHSARAGIGKCGAFDVFAEDEELGDGGVRAGVVEYFDGKGSLVGAIDTRLEPCGRFGNVPSCTPDIAWQRTLTITLGRLTATGSRLPFEVIERVTRQSMPRFKLCAAKSDAGIDSFTSGRVAVKIKIEADGSISSAEDAGSDLPSDDVKKCVLAVFRTMTMPEPDGHASMSVTIPIIFS